MKLREMNYTICGTEKINLIKTGCNSYSIKRNTQLGQLIQKVHAEHPGCLVWYEVMDKEYVDTVRCYERYIGTVSIGYKEV